MPRHKNINWDLPEGTLNPDGDLIHQRDVIQLAVLMDIRDRLDELCGKKPARKKQTRKKVKTKKKGK